MGSTDSEINFDVPKECIAGVVINEGPDFHIEVKNVPVPEIGPDDVLIKLNATGLCMSDVHFMLHDWAYPPMSVFNTQCAGHEGAGVIVKVGENVKHLKIGQRAGYKPIQDICHGMFTCWECQNGRETYCQKAVLTGLHIDGSYKQYIKSPERYTTLIPDGVSDHIAGPVMCSASTVYTSLKESGLRPGQWACFPGGGGGVGIQGVQLAAAMGLRIVVVDTGAERRNLAKESGAEAFIDFKEVENPAARVVEITAGGAHGVFVTAIQSYPIALDYLGPRVCGVVMCIGIPPFGQFHMDVDPSRLLGRNQTIKGTLVSSLADVAETLNFAARGKLRMKPTVVGLSKFDESVQKLRNGQVAGRIVVDFNMD
ncbi:putative Alcohol dehydrogenase 1 [Seiridium unicorne]|uniref:Alcohol dehydrogenase 1 n=1 Tax=Seiridium unicorne TaxID=138068 RepID=A0ABR2UKU5_9PEZI